MLFTQHVLKHRFIIRFFDTFLVRSSFHVDYLPGLTFYFKKIVDSLIIQKNLKSHKLKILYFSCLMIKYQISGCIDIGIRKLSLFQ